MILSNLLINLPDFRQNLRMGKIPVMHHINRASHPKIFNRNHRERACMLCINAGTVCDDGYAKVGSNQFLDGGNIVNLPDHMKAL